MKRTLLCLAMLALTLTTLAQPKGRSWRRGNLSLNDFGVRIDNKRGHSHLDYTISYTSNGITEGNHTYLYCHTGSVMHPTGSWMAEGFATEAELLYNQTLFDLVEVHRRQLQQQIYYLPNKSRHYNRAVALTMQQIEREMLVVKKVTNEGQDSATLESIRRINRQWLSQHPDVRPDFIPRPFWWEIGMSVGLLLPIGGAAHIITPSIGTTDVLFSMGHKRITMLLNFTQGQTALRDNIYDAWDYPLPSGNAIIFSPRISLGYEVIDNSTYSLTPYLGIGISDIYGTQSYFDFDNSVYTIGVIGHRHLHHWHYLRDGMKHKAYCFSASAFANLFACYGEFQDIRNHPSSVFLGLQIGLSLGSREERVDFHEQ